MDTTKLIARVKAILTTPKTEWPVIAGEPMSVRDIYSNHIIPLAAIPAIANFVKMSVLGFGTPLTGTMRVGFVTGLTQMVVSYVLTLAMLYVVALIIDGLAKTFSAERNQVQALKASGYAATASMVASIAIIIPGIGWLISLAGGLYTIYLLYLALPVTMKAPPEKAGAYTAVVIVATIVLGFIINAVVLGGIMGAGAGPHLSSLGMPTSGSSSADVQFDKNSPLGKLAEMGKNMEQAQKNLEAAEKSGDTEAQQKAMGQMMGSIFANGAQVEALEPGRLKAFVPDTLSGLARTSVSAERNQAMGMQVSQAEASYSDGTRALRLEIMDMGGAKGIMGLASWAAVQQDKETDTGYERTRKDGTRLLHEQWDAQSHDGEYTVIVGDRFSVKVSGQASSIDQLKDAAGSIDLDHLEALKEEGVQKGG